MKEINIYGENYSGFTLHTRKAGRGIILTDGKILLSHETVIEQWMTPGGGFEKTETAEECCIREVAEETGILVNAKECFFIANEYYEDWKYVSYYFICNPIDIVKQKLTKREIKVGVQPEWVDFAEAIEIFSKHADFAEINEERRGIYLREYNALKQLEKIIDI